MNSRINPDKLLSIWEDYWGKLSPRWSDTFLKDPRVEKILVYPGLSILSAVQKNRKLDEILSSLEESTRQVQNKVNLKVNVVPRASTNKQKVLGTTSEIQTIHEWLARINVAKLDPDSTFPKLIIKSDKSTCESKRKYDHEKDAIFALLKLEEIKGELIKQLPYKCNICRKFHNTHLISRETIQRLLRKYNPPKIF